MTIDRRDLLKVISSSAMAAAVGGVLPEEMLPQLTAVDQERQNAGLSGSLVQRAPERSRQWEPGVTMDAEGTATIAWETVIPAQGGTIYVGVPNDEIALDWPIYNAGQSVTEESARLKHEARVDLRGYASRSAPRMLLEGGTLAYRLELFDTRKSAAHFIDRHFSFQVENGKFRKTPAILEGPFLSQIQADSAIVWWVTDTPTKGEVRLSNGVNIPSESGPSEGGLASRHIVRLRDLSANTKYRYQAVSAASDGEIRSRSYTLRTSPQEPAFSFVFTCDGRTGGLGGGDMALEGINGISARALAIQMARHSPHLMIFTGDLINGYTTREDDLRAQLRSWKRIFVFVHEPAFPKGGHVQDALWGGGEAEGVKVRDRFWSIITQAGTSAVFCGHEHNYSRTLIDSKTPVHRDGTANAGFVKPVWQITQGAAGAPFYPRDSAVPWAKAVKKFVAHTWSYCLVQVRGPLVSLETYSYTGELLDQAELV